MDHLRAVRASIGPPQYEQDIASGKLLQAKDFGCHIPAAVRRVILKAVHPDPVQRYTSALEMRRALEKLNYPGHWTVDTAGSEVGICRTHEFSHSISPVAGGKFDVTCSKRNVVSGNNQRVTQFCKRGVTQKQAEKVVADFKQFVVTGK
ncbi:hypothetical protein [Paracoccus sediminilitoris]|uniref:hypothetical protein n=1 Tax=Paracoccus sediminilitoris TaxID=2202419 RepID=UPI000DB9DFDF|nr:hypothetical protein [Paracoccus sediminilitoris]